MTLNCNRSAVLHALSGVILLLLATGVCATQASAQFVRPTARPGPAGGLQVVDYVYNGQKYQFRILGGEVRQILQDGKILLMVNAGTVMAFPGADLKTAGAAQDAYKAYMAQNQPAATVNAPASPPKASLTVDGVVSMLEAGITEDVIIEKIHQSGQAFDLSTDELLRLKKANASPVLMKAMMATPAPGPNPTPTASLPPGTPPAPPAPPAPPSISPTDTQTASPAPPKPAKGGNPFSGAVQSVSDKLHGRTVIDKIGLRDILRQWDPQKPLSQQFPHVAITILNAPPHWMDAYEKLQIGQSHTIIPDCFKLQAVVWSDGEHSKTTGSFDWCTDHDGLLPQLEPNYLFSLSRLHSEMGYNTGVNRTDGPAPPETMLPNDRATLDMEAKTNPEARSPDLNLDAHSLLALMFANVRKDLGETLTADGDFRVWIVSIKKAWGAPAFLRLAK